MAKASLKSGLGRGLDALLGDTVLDAGAEEEGISRLPLEKIEPNQAQPRKEFDPEAMNSLADSIRIHGVITPITVRQQANGYYQIIAGERRWRAARMAGLTEVPAMILEATDSQVMEMALIENLQREDLNPIEEAEGYDTLMREYGMTQEAVAERVGRSRPAVANALRLLSLPEQGKEMVASGALTPGHARAILAIQDEQKRLESLERMSHLSVRQAEKLARELNRPPKEETAAVQEIAVDYLGELAGELENRLGRRVCIDQGKKSGTLTIEFYGADDLERLTGALKSLTV